MNGSDFTAHCDISEDGTLSVRLSGAWRLGRGSPPVADVTQRIESPEAAIQRVKFDGAGLADWDTGLIAFLVAIERVCSRRGIPADTTALPSGARKLLELATAVPERTEARRGRRRTAFVDRIGEGALHLGREVNETLEFLGEVTLAFARYVAGKAHFRAADFKLLLQECGAGALPIVTLITFLVGAILAFVGSVQLRPFGAQIFVANLVVVAMTREMGSLMTAIILSGRTGSAFAANLGTMMVNEEIDALETMGLRPIEFLVLPRMLALALMTPLLCVYANVTGTLGGMIVGMTTLEISPLQYWEQTRAAFAVEHFAAGLIKGSVYGVLVAIAGCLRGMQCGRSASAVGAAATSAAVTAIVYIVLADMVMTVIFDVIGF